MPPSATRKASRWREDWEVYEKLVRFNSAINQSDDAKMRVVIREKGLMALL